MKYLTVFMIISALLLAPLSSVLGWHPKSSVTPYGDFCRRCGQYGTCRTVMSPEDAGRAMVDYYKSKGLIVEIENIRGRFIKARIKDKRGIVDVIIFDRRTGRIRSIY